MKKTVVLSLAFLLPVLGAIVFKFYSRSHFDVKIMYQDTIPFKAGCDEAEIPFKVADTTSFTIDLSFIYPFAADQLKILGFSDYSYPSEVEMNLIGDTFYEIENVDIYLIRDSTVLSHSGIPAAENVYYISESEERIKDLKTCTFLFDDEEDNAMLVDEENRIRGFYNLSRREEVDSLIIETKILLREKEVNGHVLGK